MPVLDADEHVGDGEIVGDPLVFRGALDPLNSSGGSVLDVTNVAFSLGIWLLRNRELDQC